MTDDAKAKHSPVSHEQRMGYFAFQIASGEDPAKVLGMVMLHANDLAAERDELATKHKIVCECVKVVDGCNESLRRQLWAAEEKLRAAERVIGAAREVAPYKVLGHEGKALQEALSAYDAINQGSRGGAGEGVG